MASTDNPKDLATDFLGPLSGVPATIYDVARLASVSPSTVSRALHQPGRISAATAARVQAAAQQLGYSGNPLARALPTGRTNTVAIVLSDITNPVYFELVRGAEATASEAGYTLVLADSQESPERELAAAQRLRAATDGLLLVSSRLPDAQIRGLAASKPVLLTNRQLAGVRSVSAELQPALEAAVTRLAALGHRRLGYIAGPAASSMNALRWQTLFDLALAHQLSIVEVASVQPTLAGGAAALPRVLAAGISAVFAYNDLIALGLLGACREAQVMVPEQLSIIGFDDIFGAELTTPALSTIRSPLHELGATAMRTLLAALTGEDQPDRPPLRASFVERGSTGPAVG